MAEHTSATGRRGEERAVAELRARGYRVVERNYRCRAGEIDIIARDGDVLVFVEVRTRGNPSRGDALETVNAAKQRRIGAVAAHYLASQRAPVPPCRFDVVGITAGEVTIVKDAFRLS